MTYADLQNRIQFLFSYGGNADIATPPGFANMAAYYAFLANKGLSDFSWDTEYNVEQGTFTTVANQAEYALDSSSPPRYWKYLSNVVYGTTVRLFETTEQEVQMRDPLWIVAPAGQPSYCWSTAPNVLRLHPAPSTSGDTITFRGVRAAPPLALTTDIPGFPDTWHEGVALGGAIYHMKVFSEGQEGERLAMYQGQYEAMVARCKEWVGDDNAIIQRHVRLRLPQRISLGAYTGGGGYPTL